MFNEVFIHYFRLAELLQAKCHAQNNKAVAVSRIKDARPIGKTAFFIAKRNDLVPHSVKTAYLDDRFGYLLAICANVLHGRSADEARNAAEAFDASKVFTNAVFDKSVPFFAGSDIDEPGFWSCCVRIMPHFKFEI